MRRLTWLVGPPGAGKTTYVAGLPLEQRGVELIDMLGPLVDPVRMRKGLLSANGMLVQLIRHLELHPENQHLSPLLVVAGLVREEDLFPLSAEEEVLLLLPPRDRWREQLVRRPVAGVPSDQYDDYDYADLWYGRFTGWVDKGLPCRILRVPYNPELLGQVTESRVVRGAGSPRESLEPIR